MKYEYSLSGGSLISADIEFNQTINRIVITLVTFIDNEKFSKLKVFEQGVR